MTTRMTDPVTLGKLLLFVDLVGFRKAGVSSPPEDESLLVPTAAGCDDFFSVVTAAAAGCEAWA
jgi:hypothetical protein